VGIVHDLNKMTKTTRIKIETGVAVDGTASSYSDRAIRGTIKKVEVVFDAGMSSDCVVALSSE